MNYRKKNVLKCDFASLATHIRILRALIRVILYCVTFFFLYTRPKEENCRTKNAQIISFCVGKVGNERINQLPLLLDSHSMGHLIFNFDSKKPISPGIAPWGN